MNNASSNYFKFNYNIFLACLFLNTIPTFNARVFQVVRDLQQVIIFKKFQSSVSFELVI